MRLKISHNIHEYLKLGGHFGFFFGLREGKGEYRATRRGCVGFLLKIQGGGVSRRRGGERAGRVFAENFFGGGGGQIFLFGVAIFQSAQHVHLENPWENGTCAKPDFKKKSRVGLGFLRKLSTTKHRVFQSTQHVCILKIPTKKNVQVRMVFFKISGPQGNFLYKILVATREHGVIFLRVVSPTFRLSLNSCVS